MGNVHPPSGEAGAGFTTPWGLVGVNFLQWSPVKHPARGATRHAQTSSKPGSLRWPSSSPKEATQASDCTNCPLPQGRP